MPISRSNIILKPLLDEDIPLFEKWLDKAAERKKARLSLDNCPIVAAKTGDLTTLDFSLIKDHYNFPISTLLSSFELIRLENSEKALIGGAYAFAISENYIGLFNSGMPGK